MNDFGSICLPSWCLIFRGRYTLYKYDIAKYCCFNIRPSYQSSKVLITYANKWVPCDFDFSFVFRFKVSLPFRPYFYILIKPETIQETMAFLGKKYNGPLASMEIVKKEDLVRKSEEKSSHAKFVVKFIS